MAKDTHSSCQCDGQTGECRGPEPLDMLPMYNPAMPAPGAGDDHPCCGPPAGPPSSEYEKPGYALCDFVADFLDTPAGPVPRVKTRLAHRDLAGALRVRIGIRRNDYKIAPGLYAVGSPDKKSPVLVTANYKLSFDHLRRCLCDVDAWLLVLDTRGINVWCAAGKGTFGTEEIVRRVHINRLAMVVDHRKLILPQLGAPGVAAPQVKKRCGFEVVWGPVRAADLPAFLAAGRITEEGMRRVTFTVSERLVLVPVELSLSRNMMGWALLAAFIVSGIGPHVFSLSMAWGRGVQAAVACLTGVLAGCVAVPLFLPWIPGRAFSLKGAATGLVLSSIVVAIMGAGPHPAVWPSVALVIFSTAVSSFMAMEFTGATPFTSPTGVEKEMRRAIPFQLAAVLIAAGLWVGAAF